MNYISIDLGGTNLRIARFNNNYEMEEVIRVSSESDKDPDVLLKNLYEGINQIKNPETVAVGMCVPGQVDLKTNTILHCVNLNLEDIKIGELIAEKCQLPIFLNNDANLAGLAEATLGSAKDDDLVYYLTWSTGIGGALIVNGELIDGKNMYSGEIGNLKLDTTNEYVHGPMVAGSFEGISSGGALQRYALELGYANTGEFIAAAKQGDAKAVELIEYVTDIFALGITQIYHVIEVDSFVIGGGVTIKSGDYLLPLVEQKLNKNLMAIVHDKIILKTARFADDSGLIGAAILAKQKFNKENHD